MDNIDLVTEYIHAKDPNKRALHFHHTSDRKTYVFDENGFWRLFNYIPSNTFNTTDNLDIIRNAARPSASFKCCFRTSTLPACMKPSRTFTTPESAMKS